jgi:hypothetical protein
MIYVPFSIHLSLLFEKSLQTRLSFEMNVFKKLLAWA